MLWLGPGASKVHQVRNRGGSGSIDRGGVLSVLWFQGDRECLHQVGPRDFPLLGGEEAGWGHMEKAPPLGANPAGRSSPSLPPSPLFSVAGKTQNFLPRLRPIQHPQCWGGGGAQGGHGFRSLLRGYWVAGGAWGQVRVAQLRGPRLPGAGQGSHSSTREGRNRAVRGGSLGKPKEGQAGAWGAQSHLLLLPALTIP